MVETRCVADCLCHVNPYDYVPCCPIHHRPLRAAEAGYGQCSWARTQPIPHVGGVRRQTSTCTVFGPDQWAWLPRERFDARDLPPLNGEQPPRIPDIGSPWDLVEALCGKCELLTPHVEGQNRRVCSMCGTARWVPSPQYPVTHKELNG
jgi:hypothetical protein